MTASPIAGCRYEWRGTRWGDLSFEVTAHFADQEPDRSLVTSARAVVFQGDQVLVVESPDGPHIWPGGRREDGEEFEETAVREVHEETGCRVRVVERLGYVRFIHEQPEPTDYPFPYPEFWQVVHLAEALTGTKEDWSDADGWELDATFKAADELRDLDPVQQAFLDVARGSREPHADHHSTSDNG